MIYIKLGIQICMTKVLDLDKKKILLIWPRDGYDGATLPLCYIYLIPMLRKHYDVKLLDCALHEIHPESKKFWSSVLPKINNYLDFDHPHQINIRNIFSKFTEEKILIKNYGIDGCSAPQYSFKIKQLGKALSNLYKSYNSKFEYSFNIKIMIDSILKNPLFIGGSKNLDSNLIKISNGSIFCKGGAEGVFLFLHLPLEIL